VQPWFEQLWDNIVNLPSKIFQWFRDRFAELWQYVWDNIFWPLFRYTYDVIRITDEWTAGWSEPWKTVGRVFLFPAAFVYKGFRDYIGPALANAVNQVRAYFDGAVGGIFDAIRNAFSPIFEPLRRFADTVYTFFTATLPGWLKTAADFFTDLPRRIGDFFTWLRDTAWQSIVRIADFFTKDVPEFFTKTLPNTLYNFALWLRNRLVEGFQTIWDWLDRNVAEPIRRGIQFIWDRIQDAVKYVIESWSAWFNRISTYAERGDVTGIILESIPLMINSILLAVAIDIASIKIMGSGVDLDAVKGVVSKFIDAMFDPKLFTSVFAAIAIQKPMEYAVKYQFRTEIPSPGDLLKFYAKGWIDYDTLRTYMARHGFSDYWIDIYEKSVWVEPRFEAVFTAFKRGVIPESDYRNWLNILNIRQTPRPGMSVPDVAIFEESMYRLPSPFILAYAIDSGKLSFEDLRTILDWELVHPRFRDIVADALVERAYRDEKSLLRRYAIENFLDGTYTAEDLREDLKILDIQEEFVNRFIELLSKSRYRRIRNKAISYYERMFLEGRIDRREFVSRMLEMGIDREIAEAWAVLLEDVRSNYYLYNLTKDERNALASVYQELLVRGSLTEDELRLRLRQLQFSEEEIELRVQKAKEEFELSIKKTMYNDLIERLKTGMMSKSEFVDECTRIWGSVEKCRADADYYWRKYIGDEFYKLTKDERSALANLYAKLYVEGFLDESELRERLRRLGFTEQEIDLRVERAQREYEYQMLKDLIAEADTRLKKGEITEEEYVEYLVSLGMRRERAEARARRLTAGRKAKAS